MNLKEHQGVLIRFGLFLLLAYVAIPLIFWGIEQNYTKTFQLNFFYFMIFSLMMLGMFAAYNKEKILHYKFKQIWGETILFLSLSFLSFLSYFIIKYDLVVENINLSIAFSYLLYFFGFMLLAMAIFGSRFFSFFKKSIAGTILVVYIFFMGTVAVLWQFGQRFAILTAQMVHFFLSQGWTTNLVTGTGDPTLSLGSYSVIIGPPCSGVESIAMFLGVSLLAVAYDWPRIKWKEGFLVFSLGLMGIFFVNVLRVSVLMLIGNQDQALANSLFHNNLGWIFFVIYMLLLVILVYPKMIKR